MKRTRGFLLLFIFLLYSSSQAFALNPGNYLGTWSGSAKLATQAGYFTKTVTVNLSSSSGQVFKGSYNVQYGELTGSFSGAMIGSKVYFTGSYFTGEGTLSWDATKNKSKIVGCWQYLGPYSPYPYTAYFVIYK